MDATEGIDASVLSIWLGVCMDGLPEAVLIGLLAQQHHMSVPFIASVFIANFPVRPPPVLPSFPSNSKTCCRFARPWSLPRASEWSCGAHADSGGVPTQRR
jgi:hypothetical protein